MPALATGPARLVRALVVALSTVLLALGAHVLGGGAVPPLIVLVPLAAVALAVAVPFSTRQLGPVGAVTLLAAGQLGLHRAFEAFAGVGCAPVDLAEHAHTVRMACAAPVPMPMGPEHLGTGSTMVALHVGASVATALLIAGTDRALAWVATWMRPLLALLAPLTLPASAVLPARVEHPRVVGRDDVGVVPLRGPPTTAAHVTPAT